MGKLLLDKLRESVSSIGSIVILVLLLNISVAPKPLGKGIALFLVSAFLMVFGIALFNLGVDISLIPVGEHLGSSIVKSRNLFLIVALTFVLGVFVTVAEPDLIIMAGQVSGVPDNLIIIVVAVGVGLALATAFLRILFQVPLSSILLVCYLGAFVLSRFTGTEFLSIAWEAGAVTTGPILVPFIMAFGLGLASVRGDKTSEEDGFGLVALTLIGPIIAVLVLGIFFSPSGGSALAVPELQSFSDIIALYTSNVGQYFGQVAVALFPIYLVFALFQVWRLHLPTKTILKILVGTVYTYMGLVLFLASANIGFMPAGYQLGGVLVQKISPMSLMLVGFAIGFLVVSAEPAVFVLKRQVEDVTEGVISGKTMGLGLSIGVGLAVAFAMLRVVSGLSLLFFIVPGYLLALILSFYIPPLFTSIAFDSGAVASGPLAATFMLSLALGASESRGGNIFTDAFGIVALVAMLPVITISFFGLAYTIKSSRLERETVIPAEDTIIDLDAATGQADVDSENRSDETSPASRKG
ncbi:MAG TPA: DUF1538 domain-containing protein [Firmicutes bacterium]|nr:DUF1538 domain-containing protein [Bacillota bacterium]